MITNPEFFRLQAVMMDALISIFVEESKRKVNTEEVDNARSTYDTSTDSDDTHMPLTNRKELTFSCLCNKLSKLTLATFDDDGKLNFTVRRFPLVKFCDNLFWALIS